MAETEVNIVVDGVPVQSFLRHYRHEFEYMIDHGGRSLVSETQGAQAA